MRDGAFWGETPWRQLRPIEKPTVRGVSEFGGPPPWTMEVPDLGNLPDEMADMVTVLVWRGRRYRLVEEHEESVEVKEVDG